MLPISKVRLQAVQSVTSIVKEKSLPTYFYILFNDYIFGLFVFLQVCFVFFEIILILWIILDRESKLVRRVSYLMATQQAAKPQVTISTEMSKSDSQLQPIPGSPQM